MQINESFRKLIPPLSSEEYAQLEENCKADGIRDPLVVWRGTLIDGHNRYDIAQKHGLEFQVVEKDFEDETAAKIWMVTNQFGRRNLNNYQRSVLALSMEELFKEKAKGTQGQRNDLCQNSDKSEPKDTKKEIGKLANVSHDTIMRVKKIEAAATPETIAAVMSGEKSINEAYKEVRAVEKREIITAKEAKYVQEISEVTNFNVDIYNTDKKFSIIYADPAWSYWEGGEKNQSMHYKTMTIDDIKSLPVLSIADENAILFIWVTFPILQEAFEVIKSWGFNYSTCGFAWVKKNRVSDTWFFGNGAWTRANTELCLIATRGTVTRLDASISQVLDDRIMEHSQKPERVRELITRLVGKLPRIELFSRNDKNDGWFNWGNGI